MYKKVSSKINGQNFSIETGKVARQASGSVWISMGETIVLVTVVADQYIREEIDFLPLTIDYQEMSYAAGRIPSNFFRREVGRPSEREILTSRLIDRPIRPYMLKGWFYETQIIASVYSVDKVNDPDVLALTGASAALMLSEIPFNGPLAGVRIGRVKNQFIINPTSDQRAISDIDLIVAGSRDAIVMVEGEAKILSEEDILEAIWFGHNGLQSLLDLQEDLVQEVGGVSKRSFIPPNEDKDLEAKIVDLAETELNMALTIGGKLLRHAKLREIKETVIAKLGEEDYLKIQEIKSIIDRLEAKFLRKMILNQARRVDNRAFNEVRPLFCEVGILPRTHGSALFTRGETQVLVTATLGTSGDEQRIESLAEGDTFRRFLLHYNFPPFSTNEVKRLSGPSRREIGHGALARRSMEAVLPSKDQFSYSIRIVSEVLESNGSSSMASICGASLALMDAGVPIKEGVAGVAMGLILEGNQIAILTDILGDEDHLGDMDFKIAGTKMGITAIQMDIKITGITKEIMSRVLNQAKLGRLYILKKMDEVLDKSRSNLSIYAPRISNIKIPVEKIKDLIGPGGKVIRGIQAETGVKIEVEANGIVHIVATESEAGLIALKMIHKSIQEPEDGAVYEGRVVRIMDFGAFVEIMPGRDGLLHISELDHTRVRAVSDLLKEGDFVKVKVLGIDDRGKIRLSRKALLTSSVSSL